MKLRSKKKCSTRQAQIYTEIYLCHILSIFWTDIFVACSETGTLMLMRQKMWRRIPLLGRVRSRGPSFPGSSLPLSGRKREDPEREATLARLARTIHGMPSVTHFRNFNFQKLLSRERLRSPIYYELLLEHNSLRLHH